MDPNLPAEAAHPLWLPRVNPNLAMLLSLRRELFGGVATETAQPTLLQLAPEGTFATLQEVSPVRQALFFDWKPGQSLGIVIQLDDLFEDRIDAARHLYAVLARGAPTQPGLSVYRRARLKLALRALDAKRDGAGYREIAKGVFPRLLGRDREPSEAVLGRAIRLARYGLRLMRGGYLDLLRPERRAPKQRRTPK